MKVALVKQPQIESSVRGGGYYLDHLITSLSSLVNVSLIDFSLSPLAYKNFDVVHFPYFDEYFFTLPPILPKNTIISILDCTKLKFSDRFPVGMRARIAWPWQKRLVNKTAAIITISQSAKTDIERFFGIPEPKINVTYLAADPVFKPQKIKKENFVLYVGGANWNKNVIALIKACQKINIPLFLVGKEFLNQNVEWSNIENQPLKEILDAARMTENVKFLGFVPTEELVSLYNRAKVYVQPSVYEGFGLPVLEAMSCGTPVICGNNSSLAEIAGDAATYANVNNPDDLANKITGIKPTGKEIKQAGKFSWDKTAAQTYEVYEKVLAGH